MVASIVVQSVTNQEISRFWKQRHMLEEDHLYAAIKAAARLRARNLSDDEYLQFEDSLKEDDKSKEKFGEKYEHKDSRIGIKDWWTKSKYAYLNQPAMKLVDNPKRRCYNRRPRFFGYEYAAYLNC